MKAPELRTTYSLTWARAGLGLGVIHLPPLETERYSTNCIYRSTPKGDGTEKAATEGRRGWMISTMKGGLNGNFSPGLWGPVNDTNQREGGRAETSQNSFATHKQETWKMALLPWQLNEKESLCPFCHSFYREI